MYIILILYMKKKAQRGKVISSKSQILSGRIEIWMYVVWFRACAFNHS